MAGVRAQNFLQQDDICIDAVQPFAQRGQQEAASGHIESAIDVER
jgi:hypothetical protein